MRCPNFTVEILNAKWIPAWGSFIQPGDSTQRSRYLLMCTHKFSLWFNFMCLFLSLKTNRVSFQHLVKAREKEEVSSPNLAETQMKLGGGSWGRMKGHSDLWSPRLAFSLRNVAPWLQQPLRTYCDFLSSPWFLRIWVCSRAWQGST